ncbi:hypothetical protein PAMP_014217 [Pampus punctatissimus]
MDPCEEDNSVLQLVEEEQQPCNQSVPPMGSQDQMEDKSTKGQGGDSGAEWDTDLETDNDTNQRQRLSQAELYLQACQRIGTIPVSSVLRHLGEANLNLNHYGVGPLGAKALAIVLQNLSNNQLGLDGADIISKMLLDNYYIKSIKLSGNDFDDSAAKYFADALKGDYVIKELDLSHNKFCDAGGAQLGQMLGTVIGGTAFKLQAGLAAFDCHLSCSSLIFSFPQVNSTLKQLQLSWNGFSRVESESLGQALRENSTLVMLDLRSNRIDDQAVTLLCEGLAKNDTLRFLKLSHNPLTNIGALTLLKAVKNNTKSAVEEIDISTVFVCEAFVELLDEARQRRPALDIRYSVMSSVTRNIAALQIFQKFLEERNETILDFFQALDKEGMMKVSTYAFRKAVKVRLH